MEIRYLLLVVAIVLSYSRSAAQPVKLTPDDIREWLIESVVSAGGEDNDIEAVLIELENLREHPLNLNTVDRTDLQKLPFLTEFQISSFLEYRQKNGALLSVYELQVIHGFTDAVIAMMLPFVIVSEEESGSLRKMDDVTSGGSHKVVMRTQRVLEKARGYRVYDSLSGAMRYPGSPWLYNLRYVYNRKQKLQAGFTVEKDPGESLFRASNRLGFDFNSVHFLIRDMGPVKAVIAGDYRLAFGQGLTLWNGASPGKSSMPLQVVKRQDALKVHSSNDENNFFRGVAATVGWKRLTFSAFYSVKHRDANITDTLADGRIYFSSFQESGYHRTLSEIADEKSVQEMSYGGNINFRNTILKIGCTVVSYQFDKYREAGDDPEDIYDFSGNRLINCGVDYSVVLKKIQFFGETSYGNQHGATLHGMLLTINKYASFALLYRNYGAGYYSHYSSAFSESSANTNEEGFYAGMVIHPASGWKVSGYADFYHFPWLKKGLSSPASGHDFLVQADYTAGKQLSTYLRFKYESTPEDDATSAIMSEISSRKHIGVRYHIDYRLSPKLAMQNRIEMVNVDHSSSGNSRGVMFYHNVEYQADGIPLTIDFRLAWFNTDDYESRIYAYEQDLASSFSFSPVYEKGFRSYLMARLDLSNNISLRMRLANTYYSNKQVISSGLDEIDSHTRTDIKLQLSLRL